MKNTRVGCPRSTFGYSVYMAGLVAVSLLGQGCERYPHSKIDITKISPTVEYVAVKLWKLGEDVSCAKGCVEDSNLSAFKINVSPPPSNYRVGLHFGETGKTYRANITTFSPGTGTNAGKYCITDRADSFLLGPFRPNEYFGEVSVALRPALSSPEQAVPSISCVDKSLLQDNVQNQPPLISVANNISELKILESSATRTMAPPASALSITGWFLRPESHVYIHYVTKTNIDGISTAEGDLSTDPNFPNSETLMVQSRAADQITVGLSPIQNGKLRGLLCPPVGPCTMSGSGVVGGTRTTVRVRVTGGGGETVFETTP